MMDLIYTAGDNALLAQIAAAEQYMVGMRSDKHAYVQIQFLDIDYHTPTPNFERHLALAREHHPKYAVVPDLSELVTDQADIHRALRQAEQLASYCEVVLLVPKRSTQLLLLPKDYAIGYSLPTSNGGAGYGAWKLQDRRVHLLGGNPHYQMMLHQYMHSFCSVLSADGNMAQKMAFQYGKFWQNSRWVEHPRRGIGERDLPYECIRWSLQNIRQAWLCGEQKEQEEVA